MSVLDRTCHDLKYPEGRNPNILNCYMLVTEVHLSNWRQSGEETEVSQNLMTRKRPLFFLFWGPTKDASRRVEKFTPGHSISHLHIVPSVLHFGNLRLGWYIWLWTVLQNFQSQWALALRGCAWKPYIMAIIRINLFELLLIIYCDAFLKSQFATL